MIKLVGGAYNKKFQLDKTRYGSAAKEGVQILPLCHQHELAVRCIVRLEEIRFAFHTFWLLVHTRLVAAFIS